MLTPRLAFRVPKAVEDDCYGCRSCSSPSISSSLTIAEIDALQSMDLSTERWKRRGRADSLAQSIADYMAMLDTPLTTSQAARFLKVDSNRVRQRLRERSLYGIE